MVNRTLPSDISIDADPQQEEAASPLVLVVRHFALAVIGEKNLIIVLVHWKIHCNAKARQDFFAHWKNVLKIDDRASLVGEYLSEPLSPDKAEFPCSIFNVTASTKYDSYFNVGIWENAAVFKEQIIDPYVQKEPKTESFEYEFRDRMVLNPLSLRTGRFPLPPIDSYNS